MHACAAEKQKYDNNNFQNLNFWCAVNKIVLQTDVQYKDSHNETNTF
jgi:hypothetical protein